MKNLRKEAELTQTDVANMSGISLRTYQSYENGSGKENAPTYKYIMTILEDFLRLDEDHGHLLLSNIKEICQDIFSRYDVKACYLFGSYAKGEAREDSDVDLFIVTDLSGFDYFGLIEELREALHKRVDLLNQRNAKNDVNFLVNEIMVKGIKIYG